MQFHGVGTATASSTLVDFNSTSVFSGTSGAPISLKIKAHGCLMVFAWIFCATTGIIFARYYKFILPKARLFNLDFWFNIHRPLMMSVPVVSIVAFMVILADLNWKWVDFELTPISFAHSIFGILAIAMSLVQIFIAFFRCEKDHPKRFIFDLFHRFFGLSTYLFSCN